MKSTCMISSCGALPKGENHRTAPSLPGPIRKRRDLVSCPLCSTVHRFPADSMAAIEFTGSSDPSSLRSCGSRRNCARDSPRGTDASLHPIPFRAPIEQVVRVMTDALTAESRTRIVVEGKRYLRAEARSALFRFVDDVELLADEHAGLIHFRSSSRIGRRDFGVNRRRLQRITTRIRQRLADIPVPVE